MQKKVFFSPLMDHPFFYLAGHNNRHIRFFVSTNGIYFIIQRQVQHLFYTKIPVHSSPGFGLREICFA